MSIFPGAFVWGAIVWWAIMPEGGGAIVRGAIALGWEGVGAIVAWAIIEEAIVRGGAIVQVVILLEPC